MNKIIYLIALLVLLAPPIGAQEKAPAGGLYQLSTPFEGDLALGYRWNLTSGNPMAGEYQYQHSSIAGSALIEYDPLPNRFLFESYYENSKDYFGEMDYAYKDLIMLNLMSRSLFHNMNHYSIGESTSGMTVTDLNPDGTYGTSNAMNRAQVRFKAPDFAFHVYLEAKSQEKHGTIQQRFMNSFTAGDKMSRSREIDWETEEAKATVNSHLNWVEVEYSHATKKFNDTRDKVLTDTGAITYTHNLVPEIESSTDTIKIHTSHTGRIAAAVTYSSGERENKDSSAKTSFTNAAGDVSWIPTKDVTVSVKYRQYTVDADNPDSVTSVSLTPSGMTTYSVRNAISYTKDIMTGLIRYRTTKDLTLRGEFGYENLQRDWGAATWALDEKVTRTMVRVGGTYRLTNRIMLRGDISRQSATVPADSVDNTYPETSDQARATLTWVPKPWFTMLLSGGTVREERSDLAAPFADKRTSERNRLLGSFTFLAGKSTSITPSYSFFQNKQSNPIAYTDTSSAVTTETGVPYADVSHVASLAASHALADSLIFTLEAARSWSRGSWQSSGAVPGSSGIADLTNLKLVETTAEADLEIRVTKYLGYELRYQIRRLDDKLDDTQDGTNQIALATLTLKW
jgi:hypothetical protein